MAGSPPTIQDIIGDINNELNATYTAYESDRASNCLCDICNKNNSAYITIEAKDVDYCIECMQKEIKQKEARASASVSTSKYAKKNFLPILKSSAASFFCCNTTKKCTRCKKKSTPFIVDTYNTNEALCFACADDILKAVVDLKLVVEMLLGAKEAQYTKRTSSRSAGCSCDICGLQEYAYITKIDSNQDFCLMCMSDVVNKFNISLKKPLSAMMETHLRTQLLEKDKTRFKPYPNDCSCDACGEVSAPLIGDDKEDMCFKCCVETLKSGESPEVEDRPRFSSTSIKKIFEAVQSKLEEDRKAKEAVKLKLEEDGKAEEASKVAKKRELEEMRVLEENALVAKVHEFLRIDKRLPCPPKKSCQKCKKTKALVIDSKEIGLQLCDTCTAEILEVIAYTRRKEDCRANRKRLLDYLKTKFSAFLAAPAQKCTICESFEKICISSKQFEFQLCFSCTGEQFEQLGNPETPTHTEHYAAINANLPAGNTARHAEQGSDKRSKRQKIQAHLKEGFKKHLSTLYWKECSYCATNQPIYLNSHSTSIKLCFSCVGIMFKRIETPELSMGEYYAKRNEKVRQETGNPNLLTRNVGTKT